MSKKLLSITVLLLCLVLLGNSTCTLAQRQRRISSEVFTRYMNECRFRSPQKILEKTELLEQPVHSLSATSGKLYNVRYYANAQTIVCTLGNISDFRTKGAYLLLENGQKISGWYLPEASEFDVIKLFFEEVPSASPNLLVFGKDNNAAIFPLEQKRMGFPEIVK